MKIDLISQRRENVLFLSSNMAAMTSHENAIFDDCHGEKGRLLNPCILFSNALFNGEKKRMI